MRHALTALLLAGVAMPVTVPVAQAQEEAAAAENATLDMIIVTGTRRQDRTIADSPVPVDVISNELLTNQGYTETNKVLNSLVPSFNFPQPSITDGTDVVRPATLRGLGPDQTLVLINGKRRHVTALLNMNGSVGRGTAAVDMNLIPAAAMQRIEVLRDGASAQYGSDAIAGVLNIVLKNASEGGSATVSYGKYITTMEGVPNVTGLVSNNGVYARNADGTYQVTSDGERKARDGATLTLTGNIGLPLGGSGFINATGEFRDRNATNRSGYDTRQQYTAANDPRESTFDRLNHRYGDPKTKDLNVFINAGVDLSEAVELYGFLSYGQRDGESAGFYRRSNDARNRNWSASTTTFVPYYADGFLPLIVTDLEDFSGALGIKGELGEWNWDLSLVHGSNSFDFRVENSFNTSFGDQSQTEFDSGGLRFNQQTANLDIQRTFDPAAIDTISLAAGAEFRHENFKIRPGEPQSYQAGPFATSNGAAAGAQVFPGFREAIDAGRHNVSAYSEADADVSERWNVSAAVRFEDYSDFGSDWNGKIASRFKVMDALAIRGGLSTGFRAPSLHQQYYQTQSTNNVNGVLVEIGTFPVDHPVSRALGSQDLKPETSVNYSAGLVLSPFQSLNITADYYRIDVDDRIVVTENLQGAQVEALLRAAGYNNITSARFFINGIDTTTEGVDVVSSYRMSFDNDMRLGLTAAFNYNRTKVTREAVLPTLPGLDLFARVETLRIEKGQPRTKLVLSGDWDWKAFGLTARTTRYGNVLSPGTTEADDLLIEASWVTDLELRYQMMKRVQLAVGSNNLFDVYPTNTPTGARKSPYTGNYSTNNYFLPYSSFSPYGFNGRYLYGRVTVTW